MGGHHGGGGGGGSAPAPYVPPPPPVVSGLVSGGADGNQMAIMPSMSTPQISQSQPMVMSQEGGNASSMPVGAIGMTQTKVNPYATGRRPGAGAAAMANQQTSNANQFTVPSMNGIQLGG